MRIGPRGAAAVLAAALTAIVPLSSHAIEDVRILESTDSDAYRSLADSLSPLRSVRVIVSCASDTLDATCRLAARARLREAARTEMATVAVVTEETLLESDPVQYEITAMLYVHRVRHSRD